MTLLESFRNKSKRLFAGRCFQLDAWEGVGVITFDYENERINKFSALSIPELGLLLDEIKNKHRDLKSILFRSAKKDSYIVGADLDQIKSMLHRDEAYKASREGQSVFTKIEDLGIPSVAAIHGPSMGGGTEVSLCCSYRVCSDSSKTMIAVPEIKLGFIPGWGGTYRLPKLLGLPNGLDMILTGKNIYPSKAIKTGLVDDVIPAELFEEKSLEWAKKLADGWRPAPRKKKSIFTDSSKLLQSNFLGRAIIFREARKTVMKETRGNYPAPLRALRVLEAHYGDSREKFLAAEAEAFADLWSTHESRNLVSLFFLTELAKKDTGTSLSMDEVKKLKPVKSLGVLGAGVMGGGIAYQSAGKGGLRTLVKDLQWDAVSKALAHAGDLLRAELKKKRLTAVEVNHMMARIRGQTDYSSFRGVDLVIEAVVENLEIKKKVFAELETQVDDDCLIATNTSSLQVKDMAVAFKKPDRFIGLHFFNPVHKMPLVEVIRHAGSSEIAIARGVAYVKAIGKTPVVVGDGPGFLVNRILIPWLNESGFCLLEGHRIAKLDRLLKDFGMPMGPCELMDEIGLDVGVKVAHILEKDLGARSQTSDAMEKVLAKNKDAAQARLGRKSGLGFYKWEKPGGRRQEPDQEAIDQLLFENGRAPAAPSVTDDSLVRRMIFPMINEAAAILAEKIAAGPEQVDLAMIFGTGFPPFRGGLLRYADSIGLQEIVTDLEAFEAHLGQRFKPSEALKSFAKGPGKFYA
jgi:3-hydroxyacyl-CoA dehydrogenase / enoyl-CoA hydratase / 3-hydroxybutyryl-CoA epimerase